MENTSINFIDLTDENKDLRLVRISEAFANDIFDELTADVVKHLRILKPPQKIEETLGFIHWAEDHYNKGDQLVLVALDNNTAEFLGVCGLHEINTSTPEFGFWLKRSAWGKGIGTAIFNTLVNWAEENLNFDYIRYPVAKENIASRKIIKKAGGESVKEYTEDNEKQLEVIEYHLKKS